MNDLERTLTWPSDSSSRSNALLDREWLVTNGLGGYASGTIAGASTRRYHGLLIAALPAPLGRRVMLNHLLELLRFPDGSFVQVGGEERVGGGLELYGSQHLTDFRLEAGLPVWTYQIGSAMFERRIVLAHLQNTVFIHYRLLAGDGPVRLKLRPAVHFRSHDGPLGEMPGDAYVLTAIHDDFEIAVPSQPGPPLRLHLYGSRSAFTVEGKKVPDILYRVEASRGYESRGELWSPGHFRVDLCRDRDVTLVASTEPWEMIRALKPKDAVAGERDRRKRLLLVADPRARSAEAAELVLAADQFIIAPAGRTADTALAHAAGEEVRTVIAGYHWFTDWGRDTMISLEGLTLITGRHREAGHILRTFAHHIRDGLIPNLFPEGQQEGLYHTADATLWFFHALARYVEVTDDRETLRSLLPRFLDIVEHHTRGTRFGIGVDPADGLLRQGQAGYQLTWMDAKVGDWVVTPRRGKAVEINALWYNALRLLEGWLRQDQGEAAARPLAKQANRVRDAFNRRFWYEKEGYLYDVVDGEQGDDAACRPNQLFAISLPHSVLDPARWPSVLEVVRRRLLTPFGLRSLAPGHREYKPKYYGDLRARDAAYHQGTVWAWLIGPFVDAWLRGYPDDKAVARQLLHGFTIHLNEAAIGSISEIFDAEEPYTPRGCVAQAWSVAEVLRALVKTAE
jgi:predicted glycogen debranching enzyme